MTKTIKISPTLDAATTQMLNDQEKREGEMSIDNMTITYHNETIYYTSAHETSELRGIRFDKVILDEVGQIDNDLYEEMLDNNFNYTYETS